MWNYFIEENLIFILKFELEYKELIFLEVSLDDLIIFVMLCEYCISLVYLYFYCLVLLVDII